MKATLTELLSPTHRALGWMLGEDEDFVFLSHNGDCISTYSTKGVTMEAIVDTINEFESERSSIFCTRRGAGCNEPQACPVCILAI